jgi:ATP-dependent Lon protease
VTNNKLSSKLRSSDLLLIELLWQRSWPYAAGLLWSRTKEVGGVTDLTADFWSRDKARCKQTCRTLANLLFAAGHGTEGLGALMLAADPTEPRTFEIVLPQLTHAIEHFLDWSKSRNPKSRNPKDNIKRLDIWWRAARGDFVDYESSIFRLAWTEMAKEDEPAKRPHVERESEAPSIVVMPRDKSSKLNNYHSDFSDMIEARMPLKLARNIGAVRARLVAEYPHAIGAIDLLLRGLREGEPVRLSPVLVTGPVGTGKSRLIRRLFTDLLEIDVYRYDGGGASDAMFGGSPKAWANTVPSAPARAVQVTRIANPVVLVDEIDKAGNSSRHGRLWDAILPHLERETARCYRDVSLDSELDLSWITHIATANTVEELPVPLRDRYRIIRLPMPTLSDLPALAATVLQELAAENGEQGFAWPLAADEIEVIGRAWKAAGFSMRQLQRIVAGTIAARNSTAIWH